MEEEAFGGSGEVHEEEHRSSDREEAFGEGRSYNKEWCLLRHGVGCARLILGTMNRPSWSRAKVLEGSGRNSTNVGRNWFMECPLIYAWVSELYPIK